MAQCIILCSKPLRSKEQTWLTSLGISSSDHFLLKHRSSTPYPTLPWAGSVSFFLLFSLLKATCFSSTIFFFFGNWSNPNPMLVENLLYGEGNGKPLQYSCLENPMDGGAWWATGHGVAKSRIWLIDFTFTPQLRLSALVFAIDCFLEFSKTCDHIFFRLPVF